MSFLRSEDNENFDRAYKLMRKLEKILDCTFLDVLDILETERDYRDGKITINENFL